MTANDGNSTILVAAARLIPMDGKTLVAHETRDRVMQGLKSVLSTKQQEERCMIVDVSALLYNWDTYAIVAGTVAPVTVLARSKEELLSLGLRLEGNLVTTGVLLPPTPPRSSPLWVPGGATLTKEEPKESGDVEFVFTPKVDPNNDRLEHWEQVVAHNEELGGPHLECNRAKVVLACLRSMMRFFELDRVFCWDLSWGVWEAVRCEGTEADGFPKMHAVLEGGETRPLPSDARSFNAEFARKVTKELLEETMRRSQGYYLQGGSTYTMALLHNMWEKRTGHIALMKALIERNELLYMGHSAGAIMSGESILTATWKGIDAVSHSVQPYVRQYMRLPPEEEEGFFLPEEKKNDLQLSREHFLSLQRKYGAWRGFGLLKMMIFPHYDSRPSYASFPQSAETYLRATDENGRFAQPAPSFLINGSEPSEVQELREAANAGCLPTVPIANGHAVVMTKLHATSVAAVCSPCEAGKRRVHWDTYMPAVGGDCWKCYEEPEFFAGALQAAVAGDRGDESSEYRGARIVPRLKALGLPSAMEVGSREVYDAQK